MAIVIIMRWEGVTLDQYEDVRKLVDWEGDPPPGGLLHVSAHDGGALRVVDIWESAEQFQQFVDQRLTPGTKQLGIESAPEAEVFPVHALFTPGFTAKG